MIIFPVNLTCIHREIQELFHILDFTKNVTHDDETRLSKPVKVDQDDRVY